MVVGSMDFSEKSYFTGPQPCFSPDNKYIAVAEESRLVVRDIESMAVAGLFSCLDQIEALSWSPSGEHILCGLYKRGTLQVFSLVDPEWSCSITEGLAGISAARWCPSSRHILITSEFQVKLSIWSLLDQSSDCILPPKYSEAGIEFSPDGTMLALLERSDCKDILTIYDTQTWQVSSRIFTSTLDAADIAWSPDNSCIAIWESIAYGHLLEVYSPSGEHLSTHNGGAHMLGIKSTAWSPSGQLLAIGSHEQDAFILNHVTWSSLGTFNHPSTVTSPPAVAIYQEDLPATTSNGVNTNTLSDWKAGNASSPKKSSFNTKKSPPRNTTTTARRSPPNQKGGPRNKSSNTAIHRLDGPDNCDYEVEDDDDDAGTNAASKFIMASLPFKLPLPRPATDRPNPKMGIGLSVWSSDGSYLATRCDARPNILWIWDSARLELASVIQLSAPIKTATWCPNGRHKLVVGCSTRRVYVWTPTGASTVRIPGGIRASNLMWSNDGISMLVVGKDSFCCAYVV